MKVLVDAANHNLTLTMIIFSAEFKQQDDIFKKAWNSYKAKGQNWSIDVWNTIVEDNKVR